MGATDSKQKLGERVIAARKKLTDDKKIQSERANEIKAQSPETIEVILSSVAESFQSCSPFLEPTLLIAWESNPKKCKKIILGASERVLNAPIVKEEYEWFMKYVFPSSIWMFKTKGNRYMYEELIDIAHNMSSTIINSMDSIYAHLQSHPKWQQLSDIKNENLVERQDHPSVGLLQQKGITNVLEMKQTEDSKLSENMQAFVDTNVAVNILTSTAKNINSEFQNYIQTVMSHYGDYKSGPIKKVDRCSSKLENDYQDAEYPKSAKLLDLVRCSVTFNTVDQLVDGYIGLTRHISKNKSSIEIARVKNGFLSKDYKGGYRDIKVNVIYHSTITPGMSMICEVQLLLGQYLHEKKRIHKLYSIVRQELYFKMTVAEGGSETVSSKKLDFAPILNVSSVVGTDKLTQNGKCSVEQEMGLLAMESSKAISVLDIAQKKIIFTTKRSDSYVNDCRVTNCHSHRWIEIDKQKYLTVQTGKNVIKFFRINKENEKYKFSADQALTIKTGSYDHCPINCCEFDQDCKNVILVHSSQTLQKYEVKTGRKKGEIELDKRIKATNSKTMSLSFDGNLCVIGGGINVPYSYLIDIDKKLQHKLTSSQLKSSYSPCFVNGENEYIAVGGFGKIEIWNVATQKSMKLIENDGMTYVNCIYSINNILAVGSYDKKLSLWNAQNWKMIYSKQYEMSPTSVHLTANSQYLTIGGNFGEKCVIMKIK